MVSRILAMALITGCFVLAGCNTVRGFGEDLSSAGEVLQTAD